MENLFIENFLDNIINTENDQTKENILENNNVVEVIDILEKIKEYYIKKKENVSGIRQKDIIIKFMHINDIQCNIYYMLHHNVKKLVKNYMKLK